MCRAFKSQLLSKNISPLSIKSRKVKLIMGRLWILESEKHHPQSCLGNNQQYYLENALTFFEIRFLYNNGNDEFFLEDSSKDLER